MASHSPQRARSLRAPQAHQLNQVLPQNVHPRETSRSPSIHERSRPMPTTSSSTQMYPATSVASQLNQVPPQASPTGPNASRPSPPTTAPLNRHHATPPQASASPSDLGVPPSLSQGPQNHNGYISSYNHTIGRSQPPPLTRYQSYDDEYQVTPELLEEIARADLEQSQVHTASPVFSNYPRNGSTTPPQDQNINRVRSGERGSPMDMDSRRQRDPSSARESPISRQPHSPPAFVQVQNSNPDPRTSNSPARASPLGGGSSGETYTAYMARDSPAHRRAVNVNALNSESRGQYSLTTQTPPLSTTQGRMSGRSLPVQEEPEDDPHLSAKDEIWQGLEQLENRHRISSPTPSSELEPKGASQRFEPHHSSLSEADTYPDGSDSEGAKTPRSPSVGLPDKHTQPTTGIRIPARHTRTGSMDRFPLRGIDETIYDPTPKSTTSAGPIQSPTVQRAAQNNHQQRKLAVNPAETYYPNHYYADESSPYSNLYHPAQFFADDYYYGDPSGHLHPEGPYGDRSRPDAPIPPTPHSQSAAPSPSPFPHMYARNGRHFAQPSPVHPASPYPAPFEHVRRNYIPSRNAAHRPLDPHDPNFDFNSIQNQVADQWRKFAQNSNALGNMTDSTFSPSTTPFQGNFAPWAHLHARRTLGRAFDLRSMQSSPGLDRGDASSVPPSAVFRGKKRQQQHTSRLSAEVTKPALPPRVQSTQPRDTSPEPSTSGEETAGEDTYSVANPNRTSWGNGPVPDPVIEEEGDGEWVDEDDEPDEEDLLELEYHPSYVKNVTRRRRRWEIGWENLLEAFHELDRQTDATMVLLAAPSHSTKLYSIRSRSVRRQNASPSSPNMTPLKIGFKRMAAHRRKTRSHPKASLVDRFLASSGTSGEGSDTSEAREEDLRRAFGAAVNSLGAFEHIFAEREARWAEEMRRISEDRERVEMLLRQVMGDRIKSNNTPTGPQLL